MATDKRLSVMSAFEQNNNELLVKAALKDLSDDGWEVLSSALKRALHEMLEQHQWGDSANVSALAHALQSLRNAQAP